MAKSDRRDVLRFGVGIAVFPAAALGKLCGALAQDSQPGTSLDETTMRIQYLEIVTPDVDAVCKGYVEAFGVSFGDSNPVFGGARLAELEGGGMVGVRAPLRDNEEPVVRPYWLVENVDEALKKVAAAGAEIAMQATPIGQHGKFGIFIQGGIQTGLWEL